MSRDEHPYLRIGLTAFLSLSATAIVVYILFRLGDLYQILRTILSALNPLFIGFAISYILRPMEKGLEDGLKALKCPNKPARALGVLLAMAIAMSALTLFLLMVVPQLANTVKSLILTVPDQLTAAIVQVEALLQHDEAWAARLIQMVDSAEQLATTWLQANLLNSLSTIASNIVLAGSFLMNLVMSLIVAVYLLLGWERYLAQIKKLFLSISKNPKINDLVINSLHQTNRIFSGFINGKLLDSLIVGVISFIVLNIMRMPYALLISVIVGVTNIIPVFGPFIGAIPSAFLVLLVSPPKCLAFLIFVVILQQIDGNIIGPRILGDSTGLSALYVMTAMLLFGKLMGFLGMVIGVPLFATLYFLVKQAAEYSLRKQEMPLDTMEYASEGTPKKQN